LKNGIAVENRNYRKISEFIENKEKFGENRKNPIKMKSLIFSIFN